MTVTGRTIRLLILLRITRCWCFKINGKTEDKWPKTKYGGSLGPYLISHPVFTPSFKVLSHTDEPQIPFGVTRIEFREEQVGASVRSRRPDNYPPDSPVVDRLSYRAAELFSLPQYGRGGRTDVRPQLADARYVGVHRAAVFLPLREESHRRSIRRTTCPEILNTMPRRSTRCASILRPLPRWENPRGAMTIRICKDRASRRRPVLYRGRLQ